MGYEKYDTTGKRLRYFRKEKTGESREKFTQGLDVTPRTLERYENDESVPDASFLTRLNSKYQGNLNLDWLLTGRGDLYVKESFAAAAAREDAPEYRDIVLEKMQMQLDRVYREGEFLKLAALQSFLNLIDPENEDPRRSG